MTSSVVERRLTGRHAGGIALIDAVERDGAITLFFDGQVDPALIAGPKGSTLIGQRLVAGAPVLTFSMPADSRATFTFDGVEVVLTPAETELDIGADENAIVSVRNGETADTVLTWLGYHIQHHGLSVAVILDRAKPGSDPAFLKRLKRGVDKQGLACRVILVTSDLPLGKHGLPAEAHPFCVEGAPGKDRMQVPPPAPWDAPLSALTWYEIARTRFLAGARAVANIDVHDLIEPGAGTVFDTAVGAAGGLIALKGRHCYPWRIRNGSGPLFADHICVQFDAGSPRTRWCIAPAKAPAEAVWRLVRIGNAAPDPARTRGFYRHMALRHPTDSISKIVPKTSLIEHPPLVEQSMEYFGHKPVRVPDVSPSAAPKGRGRRAIVTTMKNEGAFILEWLAYHRAIGFDDILVYTNDCTDGTDRMLDLLMAKGLVEHRENRFRQMGLKPQHAALQMADDEPLIKDAKWVTCIDVDEYVNIKVGDGTLDALFTAVPDANMIAMTWRLFGNADIHGFEDRPITEQFLRCAPEYARKPHQAWGFKTLFQNIGLFKKLGVHRPKGLNPQLWEDINWVNGSGAPMPPEMFRNGWRSTTDTYGYDLVQLNHYAVRSAESFLVKRDRGRVNHADRDQGLAYWFRMNNNADEDRSILPRLPQMRAELDRLLTDPDIAQAHANAVACHRQKIAELKATQSYAEFFQALISPRQEQLSRLHSHFGANVFLSGPDCVPEEVLQRDPAEDWFFTVELKGETAH